ncbi:MAG TPA: LptE family protein [Thermoguttaceae bacterium]|nr:LptE family protein [Thermoguttaceae bacterium]
MMRRSCRCCLPWVLVLLTGCAGYRIGNQSLYPAHIRTVYVPMIESSSFRRNLGERLTEAVVKEIERTTPYKVVGTPNADAVLSARIVGETKRVLIQSRSGDPREFETNLQVRVQWLDRQGQVFRTVEPIPLPPEFVDAGAAGSLIPEVGQSVATSHQQAITRLAEQIVGLMENPW